MDITFRDFLTLSHMQYLWALVVLKNSAMTNTFTAEPRYLLANRGPAEIRMVQHIFNLFESIFYYWEPLFLAEH